MRVSQKISPYGSGAAYTNGEWVTFRLPSPAAYKLNSARFFVEMSPTVPTTGVSAEILCPSPAECLFTHMQVMAGTDVIFDCQDYHHLVQWYSMFYTDAKQYAKRIVSSASRNVWELTAPAFAKYDGRHNVVLSLLPGPLSSPDSYSTSAKGDLTVKVRLAGIEITRYETTFKIYMTIDQVSEVSGAVRFARWQSQMFPLTNCRGRVNMSAIYNGPDNRLQYALGLILPIDYRQRPAAAIVPDYGFQEYFQKGRLAVGSYLWYINSQPTGNHHKAYLQYLEDLETAIGRDLELTHFLSRDAINSDPKLDVDCTDNIFAMAQSLRGLPEGYHGLDIEFLPDPARADTPCFVLMMVKSNAVV